MAQFNPPRKQATVGLAVATRSLAINALSEVRQSQSIDPKKRPLHKADIGSHSTAARKISLLHQCLDAIGVDGRKILVQKSTPIDDICSVELVANTAHHWSIVYRYMVFYEETACAGVVVVHHLENKMGLDVHIDTTPWEEPKVTDGPPKNLTVKQLHDGYLKFLRLSSTLLEFRYPIWDSDNHAGSVVNMLSSLDVQSLESLVDEANLGIDVPDGKTIDPRFILRVHNDTIVSRPLKDDQPGWDLIEIVPHGYVRLYRNLPILKDLSMSTMMERQAEGHRLYAKTLEIAAKHKRNTS